MMFGDKGAGKVDIMRIFAKQDEKLFLRDTITTIGVDFQS